MSKPVQEINAGSMADIAFLLLIFFLVTTTMDVDSGILRILPPPPPADAPDPPIIKERNVFKVLTNSKDMLMVEGKPAAVSDLKEMAKEFFANPSNKENLSEKKEKDIDLIGKTMVTKGVISLKNDRGTSYELYINVQNELAAAVNELKDEFSQRQFGKKFDALNKEQQKAVKKAVPMAISEAEPENIGGN